VVEVVAEEEVLLILKKEQIPRQTSQRNSSEEEEVEVEVVVEPEDSITNKSPPTSLKRSINEVLPVPSSSIPVGGRLGLFQGAWTTLETESTLFIAIREGYTIPFWDRPPLAYCPPWERFRGQNDPQYRDILDTLLKKRAIERVLDPWSPGFYSSSFLVPKPNGTKRKIINLKGLNKFVVSQKFSMETPQSVLKAMRPGQWAASIDLQDAYFHIGIKQSSRKYLRFLALDQIWQYRVLCFGLKTAPHLFTRAILPLAVWARSQGIQIHVYIDDWLILAENRELLIIQTQKVVQKAQELGWVVNKEKSQLTPTRQFSFLGMTCNTEQNTVRPTEKRITGIALAVQEIRTQQVTSPRLLLSLIGRMISVGEILPYAKLERRPLQYLLRELWDGDIESLDIAVHITKEIRNTVLWWTCPQNLQKGVMIQDPREKVLLLTDASLEGWGAHLGDHMVSGTWTKTEKNNFINVLEMWAVERALKAFLSLVSGMRVQVLSDNRTVVSYITRQGGMKSFFLYKEVQRLLLWCKNQEITLEARHIPGKLNVLADKLSRPGKAVSTEWHLDPHVFKQITRQTWLPMVDLFATRWNTQLPQFISPFPDQRALEMDALSLDWETVDLPYLFPPTALIPICLQRIQDSSNRFLAILPRWNHRSWFPLLLKLIIDDPIQIPVKENLLSQGIGKKNIKFHLYPETMNLVAWPLSGNTSLREDFMRRLQRRQPNPNGVPLLGCTTTYGRNLLAGWSIEGYRIHLRPLFSY
jgi:hypothetical protein